MRQNTFFYPIQQYGMIYPDRIAIDAYDGTLTYRELNERANALASKLGALNGEVVGLCLPASRDYVVGLLAIAKAGGAFMPLDPSFPRHRLDKCLEIANCQKILTNLDNLSVFADSILKIKIDNKASSQEPEVETSPHAPAYVMFTSGSTGEPKAVLGNQRGLAHFMRWERTELKTDDTVFHSSWLSPLTFDVSLRDILLPLTSGGTLCIPDEEHRTVPHLLVQWLKDKRISHMHCVPTVLRMITQHLDFPLPDLQVVLSAGEPLYVRDVLSIRKKASSDGHSLEVINLYGPTETTLAKFFYRMPMSLALPDNPGKMIPIGRALPNTAALILDGDRLCEVGEVGEIYIRTPYRSSGYLNRPELTAQAFIVNPFTQDEKDLIYRTGDMGRYLDATGVVECLGRKDSQVKINGVRIELGEVETTLRAIEGVSDAAVTALSQPNGQKFLVGYVVIEPDAVSTFGGIENMPNVIRDKMGEKLPHTSVPSMILALDALPRTSSGKINRRLLPQPDALFYETVAYEPPTNEIEQKICELWQQLFEREKISICVPFAQFGGDSLRAIKALSMLHKTFGTNISLKEFFEASTIKALALYIRAQQTPTTKKKSEEGEDSENADPFQCELDNALRLEVTDVEQAMWTVTQLGQAPSVYNLAEAYRIQGKIDCEKLNLAFQKLGQRHESLRAIFREENGRLKELILPHFHAKLERLSVLNSGDVERLISENENYSFDLQKGPLIRLAIAPLSQGEYLLLINVHHIVCDISSLGILAKELGALYNGLLTNDDFVLPELTLTFSDCKKERLAQQATTSYQNLVQSWSSELSNLEPTTFPLDKARTNESRHHGKTLRRVINPDILDQLEEIAAQCQSSLFSVLGATLGLLLSKHTHSALPMFGSPFQGRKDNEFDQVGCFMRVLPLQVQAHPQTTFGELVSSFNTQVTKALQRQEVSLSHLLDALSVPASASFIRVLMALATDDALALPQIGKTIKPWREEPDWQTARYDVVFHFTPSLEGLALDLNYDTDLYDENRMTRLADEFLRLLSRLAYLLDDPIENFDVLTPEEKKRLQMFEKGETVTREPMNVIDQLHHWAQVKPNECALIAPNPDQPEHPIHLTWEALSQRVNLAIGSLIHQGIQKGDVIAILASKTPECYIATLALWAMGAIYMPLDPLLPDGRIQVLLEQYRPRCVLLSQENAHRVGHLQTLDLNDLHYPLEGSYPKSFLTDSAVLLFTSGSTGTPKASLHRFESLLNTTLGWNEQLGLGSKDRILHFASVSFDAAQLDTLSSIYAGAVSVLLDRELTENWIHFDQWLIQTGVTSATLPSAYIKALLRDEPEALNSLRVLVSVGEAPSAELLSSKITNGIQVFNGFGPSEAGICATLYPIKANESETPIGRPLPNTIVYLTGTSGQHVPLGCDGEIRIAGASVSMGYIDKERSKGVFVDDPIYGKTYCSGDLGRWREDGQLLYRGRLDDQIKIAGNRIEPNEIAQMLSTSPWVANAVAKAFYDDEKRPYIAIWYQPKDISSLPETATLRQWLAQRVPSYGMPRFLSMIERIPLTANGKVDYKKLSLPPKEEKASDDQSSESVSVILQIWRTLLKRPQLKASDNIFVHGADSITAIRAISRFKEEGILLSVQDIFNYPCAEDQMRHLEHCQAVEPTLTQEELIAPLPLAASALQEVGMNLEDFTQTIALSSREPIQTSTLKKVISRLIECHPCLKTRFGTENDQGGTNPSGHFIFEEMGEENQFETCASRLRHQLVVHQGVLLGVALANKGTLIVLTIHHLAIDGVSWRTLMEDLSTLLKNLDVPLMRESFSYAQRMRQLAKNNDYISELPYWKEVVISGEALPIDAHRIHYAKDYQHQTFACSKELTRTLLDCAGALGEGGTQHLLLDALVQTLHYHFKLQAPLVWVEGHGRSALEQEDLSRTVGWFTALYPVKLSWTDSTVERIADIKNTMRLPRDGGLGWSVLRYLFNKSLPFPRSACLFNYLGRFDTESDVTSALQVQALGSINDTPENQVKHSALEFTTLVGATGELEITVSVDQTESALPNADALLHTFVASLESEIKALCQNEHPLLTGGDFGDATLPYSELVKIFDQYGTSRIQAIRSLIDAEHDRLVDSVLFPHVPPKMYLKYSHMELIGDIPVENWLKSFKKLYQKSKALRAAVMTQGLTCPKVITLQPTESTEHLFVYRDLCHTPNKRQVIDQFREECIRQINDLSAGNLFRVGFFKTDLNRFETVFVFHHFILDRWAVDQLFDAIAFDRVEKITDLDAFEKWERTRDDRQDIQWWQERLQAIPSDAGALSNIGVITASSTNEKLSFDIPEAIFDKAKTLSAQQGMTLPSLLQVAVAVALGDELQSTYPMWSCKLSGRSSEIVGIENMLGCFAKDFPIGLDLQSKGSIIQVAIDFDRHFKEMQTHSFVRRQKLKLPTTNFAFIMENTPEITADTAWQMQTVAAENPSIMPIVLIVEVRPTLSLFFNFAPNRISKERVVKLAQRTTKAFELIVNDPQQSLQKLVHLINDEGSDIDA